jgi:hypothetical protein
MYTDTEAAASAANGMATGAESASDAAAILRATVTAIGSPGNDGSELTTALDDFTTLLASVADRSVQVRTNAAENMGRSIATVSGADAAATRVMGVDPV